MSNVFTQLSALQQKPSDLPLPASESRPDTQLLQSWAPRRELTPRAEPGQTGFTHHGLGECPVCGRVGQHVKLPGPIDIAFCDQHKVSLPVPPDFF